MRDIRQPVVLAALPWLLLLGLQKGHRDILAHYLDGELYHDVCSLGSLFQSRFRVAFAGPAH